MQLKILITGSEDIDSLPLNAENIIRDAILRKDTFLISDGLGAEELIHELCESVGYTNIHVYSIYCPPIFGYALKKITYIHQTNILTTKQKRHLEKYRQMIECANQVLVFWSTDSHYALKVVKMTLEADKPISVFSCTQNRFLFSGEIEELIK